MSNFLITRAAPNPVNLQIDGVMRQATCDSSRTCTLRSCKTLGFETRTPLAKVWRGDIWSFRALRRSSAGKGSWVRKDSLILCSSHHFRIVLTTSLRTTATIRTGRLLASTYIVPGAVASLKHAMSWWSLAA